MTPASPNIASNKPIEQEGQPDFTEADKKWIDQIDRSKITWEQAWGEPENDMKTTQQYQQQQYPHTRLDL